MTHKTKREHKARAKTEMAVAFEKNKDLSQWMRKVPKAKKSFRTPPPE
jgi:hypothetical protein|tara:strand:- start:1034 stop:1177 length:144 start_codon:yes stop_codon:yes gene_type:complete